MHMKRILTIVVISVVVLFVLVGLILANRGSRSAGPSVSFFKQAQQAFLEGSLIKAKGLYKKAMEDTEDVSRLKKIQDRLSEVNIKIAFSPIIDECSTEYIVQPNDALIKIARKFKTTVNFIKRANNLKSDIIRKGQKLKINTCVFSVVVDKSRNTLFLKRAGEAIKNYVVATGKNNSTPGGKFKIEIKLTNPTWFRTGAVIAPDSPDNILGSRWMGFDLKGYGIHGTTEPENLGRQITMGCIRMKNEDVEELFDIIPAGTEVTIID